MAIQIHVESEGSQMPESTNQLTMLRYEHTPLDHDLHFAMRWFFLEHDSIPKYRTLQHYSVNPPLPNPPLVQYQSPYLLFSKVCKLIKF